MRDRLMNPSSNIVYSREATRSGALSAMFLIDEETQPAQFLFQAHSYNTLLISN